MWVAASIVQVGRSCRGEWSLTGYVLCQREREREKNRERERLCLEQLHESKMERKAEIKLMNTKILKYTNI